MDDMFKSDYFTELYQRKIGDDMATKWNIRRLGL
jgi:hypothetical protein